MIANGTEETSTGIWMGTTSCHLHLLSYPPPCSAISPSSSSSHPRTKQPCTLRNLRFPCSRPRSRRFRAKARRWDSNAETVRTRKFGFGFDGADVGDNEGGGWSDAEQGYSGIAEEVLDSVWIFRVLASFGWMLPAIIASLLLATGPKAVLMALAIPLGQSAISLAINRLWPTSNGSSKRKSGTRKKASAGAATNGKMNEKERGSSKTRKRYMGYQSWVGLNNDPVVKGGSNASTLGGWEELDDQKNFNMGSINGRQQQTSSLQRKSWQEGGKFNRRRGRGEVPLLLRLLVAVFPFLDSWTKVL